MGHVLFWVPARKTLVLTRGALASFHPPTFLTVEIEKKQNAILSEVSQTEKEKYHITPLICEIWKEII